MAQQDPSDYVSSKASTAVLAILGFGVVGLMGWLWFGNVGGGTPAPPELVERPRNARTTPTSQVSASLSPTAASGPAATLVGVRLVPWQMPNGRMAKMVLTDWRNSGGAPIKRVRAEIQAFDASGGQLSSGSSRYLIFATERDNRAIQPGQTYQEPHGEGFVLIPDPLEGEPVRASVRILEAE